MNEKKVLFIINRFSGSRYRDDFTEIISSYCKRKNINCEIAFTKEPGHGTELAKGAIEREYSMVFAVGGDGTVNEVAKGLLHSSIPLGIIPIGSGNGLARHLQIPLTVNDALQLLNHQKSISIDTFTVNGRFSTNVSGIGFDGYIAGLFGKNGKRGLFSYVKLVVTHFSQFKEFEYEISMDKVQSKGRSFIISCANSSQFGNNATIAPHASLSDQMLDICLVKKMSIFQGLLFVLKLFRGTIDKSKHVIIKKAHEIELITKNEIPFHIDGEAAGSASHFVIQVNPLSLLMLVPEGKNPK